MQAHFKKSINILSICTSYLLKNNYQYVKKLNLASVKLSFKKENTLDAKTGGSQSMARSDESK
jgi:hypothetical protein